MKIITIALAAFFTLICRTMLACPGTGYIDGALTHADRTSVYMTDSTVIICDADFYDSGGPGGEYTDNENHTLTFYPETPGTVVTVAFMAFSTEPGYDFLWIYDGPDTDSDLIGIYDGTNSPGTITATTPSGALTFTFTSDISVTAAGWFATISCQMPIADFIANRTSICPDSAVIFTSQCQGYVSTWHWGFPGGNPQSYTGENPPPIHYTGTGAYSVSLTVSNGSAGDTEIKTDYIQVKDIIAGFSGTPSKVVVGYPVTYTDLSTCDPESWSWSFPGGEPQVFDGQNPPGIIYNTIGTFNVRQIVSKPGSTDTLTRLQYIRVIPPFFRMSNDTITTCSGDFYDSGGEEENYGDFEDFTITFLPASPGEMILIIFNEFNTEPGYDFLTIYNGTGTDAPLIGSYSGENGPGTITADNDAGALTFHFISDINTNRSGWWATVNCCSHSDEDVDCDQVPNENDNCMYDWNPGQEDSNDDGIGDACTCGGHLGIQHVAGAAAPVDKMVIYDIITNIAGEPSKCWISSNLGADHVAEYTGDESEASAGWYWQFNRLQGYKHDGTTRTPNTTWVTAIDENSDWTAENDPCRHELGSIWRVPAVSEWDNISEFQGWTSWDGPWSSPLKMHAAGRLGESDGMLYDRGSAGYSWTGSSRTSSTGWSFNYGVENCGVVGSAKAGAYPVRCLNDGLTTNIDQPIPRPEITIFPNPGDGLFNIIISTEKTGAYLLKVTGITGEIILERSIPVDEHTDYQLDIRDFSAGVYFLEIDGGGEKVYRKIVSR